MRLPDGAKSRALLIGTSAYEHLPALPACANNVRALQETLEWRTGLPRHHCTIMVNPGDLAAIGTSIKTAAEAADDMLLVYYSGHSMLDHAGALHLCLPQSSQQNLPWSGIPFDFLSQELQASHALTTVLILDCSFSGIAVESAARASSGAALGTGAAGSIVLGSSSSHSHALAFPGSSYSEFTGTLLEVLENGSRDGGGLLTIDDIYERMVAIARERNLPMPQLRVTGRASKLALARNPHLQRRTDAGSQPVEFLNQFLGDVRNVFQAQNINIVLSPSQAPEARFSPHETNTASFMITTETEAYDKAEVDAFLYRLLFAMVEPIGGPQRMNADEARGVQFTRASRPGGYDVREVDAFLDRAVKELERRERLSLRRT